MYITKLLLPFSLGLLALHFVLENEMNQEAWSDAIMTANASTDSLTTAVVHISNVTA
jgi:hypothetical protein